MLVRASVGRFLSLAFSLTLAVATATVALHAGLWWLLLPPLFVLWMYGFSLSHAYILAHDGIGPKRR